jgi:predicted nucleic acid-binding protein
MVPSSDVLELAVSSGCSTYDCEFVVLARNLAIKLVTMDRKVLDAFPDLAVPLS